MRSTAIAIALWLASASVIAAQPPQRARVFGGGFGMGVGVQRWTTYELGPGEIDAYLLFDLGSLELAFFVDDHLSVDLSSPLFATLVSAGFGDLEGGLTAFLDWSIGDGANRLLLGPGVGFVGHTDHAEGPAPPRPDGGVELRVALTLGYEAVPPDRVGGVRIVTRPWLGLGAGQRGFELGGGALLEAVFLFYAG